MKGKWGLLYFLGNQLTRAGEVRAWTDPLRVNSICLAALRPSLAHFLRILEVLGGPVCDATHVALELFHGVTSLLVFVGEECGGSRSVCLGDNPDPGQALLLICREDTEVS